MDEPIFSPDGKFMWTGTEWIPAPPKSEPEQAPEPEPESTSKTVEKPSTDDIPVQAESPLIEPIPPRPPMPAPMPAPMPVPAGLPPGMSSSPSSGFNLVYVLVGGLSVICFYLMYFGWIFGFNSSWPFYNMGCFGFTLFGLIFYLMSPNDQQYVIVVSPIDGKKRYQC
ncbi:MAG: hypothetical protein QGH13_05685, partial [Candidatus Thalassarchaeaceae archaeon]|nr:hypothetical protein [Candidatus Thalassarchaeaceae archaeon]